MYLYLEENFEDYGEKKSLYFLDNINYGFIRIGSCILEKNRLIFWFVIFFLR